MHHKKYYKTEVEWGPCSSLCISLISRSVTPGARWCQVRCGEKHRSANPNKGFIHFLISGAYSRNCVLTIKMCNHSWDILHDAESQQGFSFAISALSYQSIYCLMFSLSYLLNACFTKHTGEFTLSILSIAAHGYIPTLSPRFFAGRDGRVGSPTANWQIEGA